ncbi:hypothetical protein K474DRAFT_1714289 [Panus rudis PR-1116 ss-1]|nr:hypothetical protein K474DRAFT_1714289 [Panus rudis PR-1116 ss-1]
MNLDETRKLHNEMVNYYPTWVNEAGREWIGQLFSTYTLTSVSYITGQNVILSNEQTEDDDRAQWERRLVWGNIRYLTVAIASHLLPFAVADWEPIDPEEILNSNDKVFTSPNPETREEVQNLYDHELLLPNGQEVYIYSKDGFRIPRRNPILPEDYTTDTVTMLNLRKILNLFRGFGILDAQRAIEEFGAGFDEDRCSEVKHYAYPMLNLHHIGHFQADGPICAFQVIIHGVNTGLHGLDVTAAIHPHHEVVKSIASQGYNCMAHSYRADGAQFHEAQRGIYTAAAAGSYAPSNHRTAKTLRKSLRRKLEAGTPHERFMEQVTGDAVDTSLRLENIYVIDMDRLPAEKQRGNVIFDEILLPLARGYQHPFVIQSLRTALVVFKPDVFPNIYKWVNYPVVCALESLWKSAHSQIRVGNEPSGYIVELIAVLERAYNFSHTGHAKVISVGLMNALWCGKSLIKLGTPCLNPKIVTSHKQTIIGI